MNTRTPTKALLTAPLALMAACATPSTDAQPSPVASARRFLAAELSANALANHANQIAALPRLLGAELERVQRWPKVSRGLQSELRGARQIAEHLDRSARSELARRPRRLDPITPNVRDWEQDMADDLDLATRIIWASPRPLNEISDRSHRTDPRDNRDELTFWQRLRRRLRL